MSSYKCSAIGLPKLGANFVGEATLHPQGSSGRRNAGREARTLRRLRKTNDSSTGIATPEALDIARYVTDMAAQLEAMATAARLDLPAYFLGLATVETELFIRTAALAEAEREIGKSSEAGSENRQRQDDISFR